LAADEFAGSSNWPQQLYIREGHRLISEFVLTQSDVQVRTTKPDSIGIGSYEIDGHPVSRYQVSDNLLALDGPFPPHESFARPYQIPMRSMVPQAYAPSNLLVSVCVGATHVAWSSLRMEPQFMTMGEAAGRAAALAIASNSSTAHLDVKELQRQLRAAGGVLDQ
jgi:hypothetical protein